MNNALPCHLLKLKWLYTQNSFIVLEHFDIISLPGSVEDLDMLDMCDDEIILLDQLYNEVRNKQSRFPPINPFFGLK